MMGITNDQNPKREDEPRMGGQWQKTPRWVAGGTGPSWPDSVKMNDASAYFGPKGGSEFEAYSILL
jgi:hypothetical protein